MNLNRKLFMWYSSAILSLWLFLVFKYFCESARAEATKIVLEFARADFGFQPRIDLRHFLLFLSFLVEGWMEDFLEVLLVGFSCNLVVGGQNLHVQTQAQSWSPANEISARADSQKYLKTRNNQRDRIADEYHMKSFRLKFTIQPCIPL